MSGRFRRCRPPWQTNSAGCESFGDGRVLGKAYQDEFIGPVELRLQEAGVRLAAMIHEGLQP